MILFAYNNIIKYVVQNEHHSNVLQQASDVTELLMLP